MADETPRLNLDTFSKGDTNWDHTDVVELVDELITDRGSYADLPATGEYDGETFLAEDRRIVFQWDATAEEWDPISGLGTEENPVPGTSHYEAVHAEVLNNVHYPVEYGAAGDGSTDDRSAINELFDNESVIAFKPDTTYFISDFIRIINSDRLIHIPESTTILADVDSQTDNSILELGSSTQSISNVRVEGGGKLDGQSNAFGGGSNIVEQGGGALNFFNCDNIEVYGIKIRNAREYGLEMSHTTNSHVYSPDIARVGNDCISVSDGQETKYGSEGDSETDNVHFYNVTLSDAEDAEYEIDDGPQRVYLHDSEIRSMSGGNHSGEQRPANIYFVNCTFRPPEEGDEVINDSDYQRFTNCNFISENRIFVQHDADVTLENCTFQSTAARSVRVQRDNKTFRDCTVIGGTTSGIQILSGSNITIDNLNGELTTASQAIEVAPSGIADVVDLFIRRVEVDGSVNDVKFSSGTNETIDARVEYAEAINHEASTRARYHDVIGGGPLGGVDLSAVSGQFAGDKALSDGSSGDTNDEADTEWIWTGSAWKNSAGDTITPS